MRTNSDLAVPIALLSALAGCSAGPTLPVEEGASLARSAGAAAALVTRPITGGCTLTFSAPPLPPPPSFEQVDTGICQLSHLGRTTFAGVQQISLVAGTQSGERTFTAANGDMLYATHTGTSSPGGPGLVSFVATVTFSGGTGRFTNASGQATASGTANLITRTTTMELEGWISYTASDRSR